MLGFGLVDAVIPEPAGGAHWDYAASAELVKEHILKHLEDLRHVDPVARIRKRIDKYGNMGFYDIES
jgi:acetyl-CoA carboxylase carboxyl transferase subunit alpha